MNLKKLERYLWVNLLGPGPRLIKKEFTGPRSHKGWETLLYCKGKDARKIFMSITKYGAVYAETAAKEIQNCFCVSPLCWILFCLKMDKALVGNFGRELEGWILYLLNTLLLSFNKRCTWSDNKVRELIEVKVQHTSLLNTTMVAFKVLPLGSYAPMPAPSPPFKTILELVLWNDLHSCCCITPDVISVIKMPSFQYFLYLQEQKKVTGG